MSDAVGIPAAVLSAVLAAAAAAAAACCCSRRWHIGLLTHPLHRARLDAELRRKRLRGVRCAAQPALSNRC